MLCLLLYLVSLWNRTLGGLNRPPAMQYCILFETQYSYSVHQVLVVTGFVVVNAERCFCVSFEYYSERFPKQVLCLISVNLYACRFSSLISFFFLLQEDCTVVVSKFPY